MSNENFLPNTEFNLVKTTPEGYTEFYVKLPYTTSRVVGYVRSHGHATCLSIMNSRIGNFDVTPDRSSISPARIRPSGVNCGIRASRMLPPGDGAQADLIEVSVPLQ